MQSKKTMIVNESAASRQLVQGMFSRGVMSLSGRRPAAANWELVRGVLAQPHLVGKRS
ncbi:MAG: hypothetical protein WBO23_04485 [Burkholderiales bacterium]